LPGNLISNPPLPRELGPTLLVVMGGVLLAMGLSRRPLFGSTANDGPMRRAAVAAGKGFEQADTFLRRWPSAGLALLMLLALFGWSMLARAPQ
jgi:hypothetical protein